jgi:LysM repeat protein
MKRISIFLIAGLLLITPALRAQDAAAAAAKADRDAEEERFKRLSSAVDDLRDLQMEQQKHIAALMKEMESLREQVSKPSGNYAGQDELRKLAETVQKIDQKRVEDNERILKEIDKLAKTLSSGTSGGHGKKPPKVAAGSGDNPSASDGSGGGPTEKGFNYTIASGDTLSTICQAYKEQKGIKVTVDQILKANPKLEPTKLRVGQKIWIPAPEKP